MMDLSQLATGEMVPPPGMVFPGQQSAEEGESQSEETEPMTEQHLAFLQQVRICISVPEASSGQLSLFVARDKALFFDFSC